MALLNFSINGKNSFYDFGWIIKSSNHENLPAKRYESKPIPGRTGNLIIEEKAKDNKKIDIEAYVNLKGANPQLYGLSLADWLQGFEGYSNLTFNDGYQFEAITNGEIEIERMKCDYRSIKVTFEVVPIDIDSYKYVLSDENNKVMLTDDTRGIEVNI